MYTARNEGKSAVAARFIKTLKGKINNIMIPYDRKFYLGYLNKLVDECYNSYHRSIGKKPIHGDYSAYIFFGKIYTKNQSKEISAIDSVS